MKTPKSMSPFYSARLLDFPAIVLSYITCELALSGSLGLLFCPLPGDDGVKAPKSISFPLCSARLFDFPAIVLSYITCEFALSGSLGLLF